eukprot:11361998-Alexandrium_andersonii.AAC.1
MSASLVGSEMCIRDRVRNWYPKLPTGESCASVRTGSESANEWGNDGIPCLLYTSDAADDM